MELKTARVPEKVIQIMTGTGTDVVVIQAPPPPQAETVSGCDLD